MFVYVIVNSENLKIYVGQHKGDKLQKYLQTKFSDANHNRGGSSHLYTAMRKYPKESWSIHPLISGIIDKQELDETERLLIYALKAQHPDVGYNICDGGEGRNGPMTEETKRKISEEHKKSSAQWHVVGNVQSPETIARRIEKTAGQKRTPEQVFRISEGRKGKGLGSSSRKGKTVTEEHKKNINRSWTPERRAAWSEYKKAHPTGVAVKHKIAEPGNAARQF